MAGWEHFYHVADIGVRGRGATLEEAFEQAALALTAVVVRPEAVCARQAIEVCLSAPDRELLLVEWLDALIYQMAVRHMLFSRFQVEIHENRLGGTAWGEMIDRQRHQAAVEIKGATFTELAVHHNAEGCWTAQCVVDV